LLELSRDKPGNNGITKGKQFSTHWNNRSVSDRKVNLPSTRMQSGMTESWEVLLSCCRELGRRAVWAAQLCGAHCGRAQQDHGCCCLRLE
jgi:hypothetical protein